MNGFTLKAAGPVLGYHSFMTIDDNGDVDSVHQVPDEGFSHVCDAAITCLCGPQVVHSTFHGDLLPMVRHSALDKAYYVGNQVVYEFEYDPLEDD